MYNSSYKGRKWFGGFYNFNWRSRW